ncbi:Endonuclease/exonuclease/phosphatase family protein [Sulfidibacter corallicola]|uniref:Endonuclease/exonuclease/phosphatase family protein n=1 Tax=Sulfidibacter corallicola TaxID=2818388 RepID=A0A8A4TDS8_SULCO|nr:endonuclease/exonuclease/phosphatase family protein [Sulfidibacter corallicola]QTD48249.1 endonuclease/exonuclease/phosphatase family protein [Sulfidibacter corallicola]
MTEKPRFDLVSFLLARLEVPTALLCLAVVCSLLARYHLLFELTSHFQHVYFAASLVSLAAFGWTKRRIWFCISLVPFVLSGVATAPYWGLSSSGSKAEAGDVSPLRVLFANVHGSNRRHELLGELVARENPDVIVLAEVNGAWVKALDPLSEAYPHRLVHHREDNFGIALFSRIPLESIRIIYPADHDVPAVEARLASPAGPMTIFGVHPLPPIRNDYFHARNRQMAALGSLVAAEEGAALIAGDFNATVWSPFFRDFLKSAGMEDARRGRGVLGSWPAGLPIFRIPIDHILVGSEFRLLNLRLGPSIGSDHLPVLADVVAAPQVAR